MQRSTFGTLCQTLVGQTDFEAWSTFTPADWERLVKTAQAHGVAPLLYHVLGEVGWPEQMPADLRRDLRAAYHNTAAQNLLVYQELARILTALDTALVGAEETSAAGDDVLSRSTNSGQALSKDRRPVRPSAVVLKGAALAAALYPNIGLRPMSDLDLLIPKEQLKQAVEVVRLLGYVPEAKRPEIRPGLARLTGYEVNFDGGEHIPVHVELHWNLIGGEESCYRPRIEWFWEQTEPLTENKGIGEQGKKGGKEHFFPYQLIDFSPAALQLMPTAHLLYLGAHLALKHGEAHAYLRWFYDIHLLVTQEGHRIDWDEFVLRAEEFRWAAALYAALQGVQDRLATQLPDGVLDALAETQDRKSERLVGRKTDVQTRAGRTWDTLASHGWRARLHLAWALVFPSPAYMRWRYSPQPAWLWPLWYSSRWFDILRDGLSTLWQIVRRG